MEPEAEHERLTFQISRNVLDHERQLGWDLLQNPARLRIETIDALCAAITRRMPWLARFGAMPEISEKAEDLYREAARNTLAHLENGHAGSGLSSCCISTTISNERAADRPDAGTARSMAAAHRSESSRATWKTRCSG